VSDQNPAAVERRQPGPHPHGHPAFQQPLQPERRLSGKEAPQWQPDQYCARPEWMIGNWFFEVKSYFAR